MADHLTKAEACALLGRSKRALDGYIAAGKLAVTYVSGPHGREARIARGDVERLQIEIETPLTKDETALAPSPNGAAASPSTRDEALAAIGRMIAQTQTPAVPPAVKPHMTLQEAVEYSGLPAAWLVAEARAGRIRAVNVGRGKREFWRFARE